MRLLDLFVFKYNRTDFHELNLDWIISDMRTLAETLENFVSLNTIKYANPIQWNITKQYGTNTVVIDANDGTAYLSVQPVPTGVAITNTDYWTPIFTLNLLSANQNITLRDDGSNVLATFASNTDDWLIWNATLYKVSQPIAVNEAYVAGYNLDRYSVELFIKNYIDELKNEIGELSDLNTTDKTNLVAAINEVLTSLSDTTGKLSDLDTTDKSNLVAAINELSSDIDSIKLSFDTVADMLAGDVSDGNVYRCDGFYNSGDKGFGFWLAASTEPSIFHVTADNGVYLIPVPLNNEYNSYQFGCYGDDDHDDTTALQAFIETVESTKINGKIGPGTFKTTSALIISGRNITILGSGIDVTIIKRYYDASNTDYHAIRLTGQFNWGLILGNFTLTQDYSGHGAGICFGDGVSDVGGTYHSVFKPIAFNNFQYGLFVESTTTSFWGCKFEYLIFTEITWNCINNEGLGGGIPNNLFEHITTYRCGLATLQRTAQFVIRGYNQKIINLEVLHPVTTIFSLVSGSYLKIDNFKIEDAVYNTASGTTYIAILNPYSELDIDYYYLIGNFTKVNNLVTYSTSSGEATFNINNLFHYYESGSTPIAAICSGPAIKGHINDTMIMQQMPFTYASDVNIKNGLLESGSTVSSGTNTTIEPSKVKTFLNPTNNNLTLTINNDPTSRTWNYGSNLSIDIINAGTGTITVKDYAGNTIGTIAASTKKTLLMISSGLYIPYI